MPELDRPSGPDFIARYAGKVRTYEKQEPIYAQGDRADELFYILSGKVLVTIVTKCGKEALIAVPMPGQFFGEDCAAGEAVRSSTVTAATACEVVVLRTTDVLKAFNDDPDFTKVFVEFLMERNKQLKTALVDQMLLSSEKRLARLFLRLIPFERDIEPELADVLVNQDMIARMIGTTRSRVNEFMNKFRKLGHIEYSHGQLKVHSSLQSVLTDDAA